MKKILFYILFIFTIIANAQIKPFAMNDVLTTPRFRNFYQRVINTGVNLEYEQIKDYKTIFKQLRDSGLIGDTRAGDSLAIFYVFTLKIAKDTSVAKLNLLDTTYTIINSGVVFSDSGAIGNGINSYLKTGFNFKKDTGIVKNKYFSIGIYLYKGCSKSISFVYGANDGNSIIELLKINNGYSYIFLQNSIIYPLNYVLSGYHLGIKRGTDTTFVYYNNNKLSLPSFILTTPDAETYIFIRTDLYPLYSNAIITFFNIGTGLSEDKANKITNILNDISKKHGINKF